MKKLRKERNDCAYFHVDSDYGWVFRNCGLKSCLSKCKKYKKLSYFNFWVRKILG